ncbi:MAG TPA: hypothetical protein VFR15_15315 [Chloroflexia bacterium]|nr:hypothetical protein [Chloroflexia bacterium]
MAAYIFVTSEGYTYQPGSESVQPDIDNLQVIGFALGSTSQEALKNLIAENPYMLLTAFNEVECFELRHENYLQHAHYFSLQSLSGNPK